MVAVVEVLAVAKAVAISKAGTAVMTGRRVEAVAVELADAC